MNKINLTDNFGLSRIIHGQMRMGDWKMSSNELSAFMEELVELGVTSFDHADIYGNYSCEAMLGNVLNINKSLRNKIEIITKCGIMLVSDKFPERKIKYYDYSFEHIVTSVNNSLKNLGTDHIDLLLLHRPAPFFDPAVVAEAIFKLKKDGKVLCFGVSNFTPGQYEMLSKFSGEKLVTNQVEISPYCLEHFENGNIDFFLKENIKPMAWSPLAAGKILNPHDDKGPRILRAIMQVAEELNIAPVDKVIYAWLLKHPATIMPVVGTGKIERIKSAVEALDIEMSLEQWYKIYIAVLGKELP
ncbi:MAG: aldo/keto reductase [Bacteroidales bacterium]|nr:aldo/keto reductase [Bacteroidales bacterium]